MLHLSLSKIEAVYCVYKECAVLAVPSTARGMRLMPHASRCNLPCRAELLSRRRDLPLHRSGQFIDVVAKHLSVSCSWAVCG